MNIKLEKKFTDKELDKFIDKIYSNFKQNPNDKYNFDLTEVEFIGNQELLFLSSLWKSFYESNIKFEVEFLKKRQPVEIEKKILNGETRVFKQIIQFCDVWKIFNIVPANSIKEYFGFDITFINILKEKLNYYPKVSEIYSRHGVTPFVSLNHINNYNEIDVQKLIKPIYKLNSVIADLLDSNNCYHPFTSNSLSTIITEELYLNFLDHSIESSFPKIQQYAFMSISFQPKTDETENSEKEIQDIKALNFKTECLEETRNFYYDTSTTKFKNNPCIQFSFLDFGKGIVDTLKEQYQNSKSETDTENFDSDVLRYAFNHDSSRHPIFDKKNKQEKFIPRGLFDALTIVRRYKGLLIVRSNFGKILFDFSKHKEINKAFSYFGNNKLFFPGTLISLYIPAIEDATKIDVSAIKPEIDFAKVKPENKKYLSVTSIVEKLKDKKDKLYSTLLQELKTAICNHNEHSLVFISFKGCEIEKRIIKKTIYFLLTDYEINHLNNVVILNSPDEIIIDEIASEILSLNDALKNYKIHPLPIIDFTNNNEDLNIKWLGIYDNEDKLKLNELLYENYSIAKSDFKDPANISGHLNEFDSFGNLISNFPNRDDIINFYRIENETLISKQVEELLGKHNCIKKDDERSLYLCNGNYYQKEYVELNNLVNDKNDCNTITQLLYSKLKDKIKNIEEYIFIGITTTSHKILKSIESQKLITSKQYVSFDNYHTFENELSEINIDSSKKYILICDVISTGFLTKRLNARLAILGTGIEHIAVVTSTLHPKFETTKSFLAEFESKTIFLHNYPITKYKRSEIAKEIFVKNTIRINPHTNIPITLSINETNFNESIIFHSEIQYSEASNEITIRNNFLDSINKDAVHIGFYKFNNLIHPYFFDTEIILKEFNEDLLKDIFKKIKNESFENDKVQIFYPRKSGIDFFNFDQLKSVINNHFVEEIEIERFGTSEGWRFPHNTDYLSAKIENNFCFILDDGSCSGDSLIQMIDEISFYDAKEIVLLCIIGRVNDHKREFFSRLSNIKVRNGKSIPISIYFVCHWHIPTYYLDENPNTKETSWLNDILNLQNTPQSIKKIAKTILDEINPKEKGDFRDYKYLPRIKEINEDSKEKLLIPKKELLIVREELGKVIGYRLYKESFVYFDCFIRKYQKPNKTEGYFKEIELLCATFVYEPYLYDKIIGILPDITERIESFVENLIFSNENIFDKLTYKWNKKDIVHLFFITFKNDKLIEKLTTEKLIQLIQFTKQVESTTSYILYKLLKYFPLTSSQFSDKKFDSQIKELIASLKDNESIPNKEVKKYYNFITTLPSRDDFDSQLGVLVDNYYKQETPEYHLEKKSFDNNVSNIISAIRDCIYRIENNKPLEINQIFSIRDKWFGIMDFLIPILRFSSSFPEYLVPYSYFNLILSIENGDSSIRGMVEFNERLIFLLNEQYADKEKLFLVERNILRIQLILQSDSPFYQLIKNRKSSFNDLITGVCQELRQSKIEAVVSGSELLDQENMTLIPKLYSDELIRKELVTNIKNHSLKDENLKVFIDIVKDENSNVKLTIKNIKAKKGFNKSNLEGIKCIKLMASSNLFGFNYVSTVLGDDFIQILTFKIIENGHK